MNGETSARDTSEPVTGHTMVSVTLIELLVQNGVLRGTQVAERLKNRHDEAIAQGGTETLRGAQTILDVLNELKKRGKILC